MDSILAIPMVIQREGTVFYQVAVRSRGGNTQWKTEKRYSQFDTLYVALAGNFPRIPLLPPKTFLRTTEGSYLEYRRAALEQFLIDLSRRYDTSTSVEFLTFLNYFKEIPAFSSPKPALLVEEHIAKPIKAGYLTADLFIYTQFESFFMYRVDSYLNSLPIPFRTARKEYLGYTEIHTRRSTRFAMKWRVSHELLPTALAYSPHYGLVFVGFESGHLHGFLVNADTPHIDKPLHTAAVRGLTLSSDSSQLVSVSDDRKMIVLSVSSQSTLFIVSLPAPPLHSLWWESQLLVVFTGNMALFSYGDGGPALDVCLSTESEHRFASVTVGERAAYVGTDSGLVVVYRLDLRKECGLLEWIGRITAICHSRLRNELFVSNDKGSIAVFQSETGTLLFVFSAGNEEITYLAWDESESLLFISGDNRKLCLYRLPAEWTFSFPAVSAENKSIPLLNREEDDLAGWDR